MPCSSSALTSEASEKLLGFKVCQRDRIAFLHRRQDVIVIVRLQIVGAFLVDRDIPGCDEGGAVRTQDVALGASATCEQIDGDRVKDRVTHLTGDRALPDERVQAQEISLDLALDVRGRD